MRSEQVPDMCSFGSRRVVRSGRSISKSEAQPNGSVVKHLSSCLLRM